MIRIGKKEYSLSNVTVEGAMKVAKSNLIRVAHLKDWECRNKENIRMRDFAREMFRNNKFYFIGTHEEADKYFGLTTPDCNKTELSGYYTEIIVWSLYDSFSYKNGKKKHKICIIKVY